MKKILISLSVIAAVAAIVVGATTAYFSDTEKSEGNTFTAGSIDLLFNDVNGGQSSPIDGPLFTFGDMKPGDTGEKTVSLAVDNNPACGLVNINLTEDKDNSCTEPEKIDETGCTAEGEGELNDSLQFFMWRETDCDNVFEEGETPLTVGTLTESVTYKVGELPIVGAPKVCYGIAYCFGAFNEETGACSGAAVNNASQSDSFKADIIITATQKRNQYDDGCPTDIEEEKEVHSLTLENETINPSGPWTVIEDNIKGLLTWKGDGDTFEFDLTAQNLPINTQYSLIYYADPYPGSNPGALIKTFMTDGSGSINSIGNSVELGMDLPAPADANYATGAKIWLIPSANYDAGTKSVTPWAPDTTTWLFEGNVYIHYNDTNN